MADDDFSQYGYDYGVIENGDHLVGSTSRSILETGETFEIETWYLMNYDKDGNVVAREISEARAKEYMEQIEQIEKPDQPYIPPAKHIINSQSQGTGPTPISRQGMGIAEDQPVKEAGDPLLLFTGQFHHQITDLQVNGRGLNFCFKRTYFNKTTYKGSLGYGWDHNYNLWLREERVRLPDGSFQNVVYRSTGELRQDPYTQITGAIVGELPPLDQFSDAQFSSPMGFYDRLEKSGQKYVLETVNGLRLEYNEDLYIDRMIDNNGNEIKFEYSNNLLTTIIDPVGKKFILKYDEMNRIIRLDDETGGRSITYHYSDNGDLEEVDLHLLPDIVTGIDYRYLGPNFPIELQHNLIEIIIAKGESVLENEYGIDPGSLEFNRVIRQRSNVGEFLYEYENVLEIYNDPNQDSVNHPITSARVIFPNNHIKEYWFNTQGNAVREIETVISDTSGLFDELVTSYRYNEDGLLIEKSEPDGSTIRFYHARENYAALNNNDVSGATPAERLGFGNLLRKVQFSTAGTVEDRVIVTQYSYHDYTNRLKSQKGPYYADAVNLLPLANQQIYEINFLYDSDGNLEYVVYPDVLLPDGTTQSLPPTNFIYDTHGLITDIVVGDVQNHYVYFADNLRSGFLKEIVEDKDKIARRTQFEVDEIGRIIQIRDHYGSHTDIEWTKFDTLRRIQLPIIQPNTNRPIISYEYDQDRQLTKITEEIVLHNGKQNPSGALIQKLFYDEYGRLKRHSLESESKPISLVRRTSYTPFNQISEEVNFLGNKTLFKYNERMLVSAIINGLCTTEETIRRIHYDRAGNLIRYVDARGFSTTIEYDGFRRPKRIRDPDDRELIIEYDAGGHIVSERLYGIDPHTSKKIRWSEIGFEYDKLGRTVARNDHVFSPGIQNPDDIILRKQFFYDHLNRICKIVDPSGPVWSYEYDGLNRLTFAKDGDNNKREWIYDDTNRTVTTIQTNLGVDELHNTVTHVFRHITHFDTRGFPVEEIDGLENVIHRGFDSRGFLTHYTEANQQEYFSDYDIFGQIVSYRTQADGNEVSCTFDYDYSNRTSTVTTPTGGIIRWYFDALNRVTKIQHGDDSTMYLYDSEGNIISKTDGNGSIINYTYSPAGLLERQEVDFNSFTPVSSLPSYFPSQSSKSTYKYTPLGNIAEARNDVAIIKLYYDSLDRVTEENSDTNSVQYKYDDTNRTTCLIFPNGRNVLYTYSGNGALREIIQNSLGLQYPGDLSLPPSRTLASISRIGQNPNVIRLDNCVGKLRYDAGMNMIASDWTNVNNNVPILSERNVYGCGRECKIYQINKSLRVNEYDTLTRLTGVAEYENYDSIDLTTISPPSSESDLPSITNQSGINEIISNIEASVTNLSISRRFTYKIDYNENREETAILPQPNITTYVSDKQDRYITIGNDNLIYDRNANVLYYASNSYRYDVFNRISEIDTPLGKIKIFYDALGRRLRSEFQNKIQEFVYAGTSLIEWRENGILSGQLLPLERPHQYAHLALKGTDYVPIFDKMDSILGWTRFDGEITNRKWYDPFGQILEKVQNEQFALELGFGGYEVEEKSGTYLLPARVYSPTIGRFLQRDPSGIADGLNLYSYSHHSPGTLTDYWGLDSEHIDIDWTSVLKRAMSDYGRFTPSTPQKQDPPSNISSVRELLQFGSVPRNILGEAPRGTLHLWSGDAAKQVAKDTIVREGSGWMMGNIKGQPSTTHAASEMKYNDAMAAALRRNPGVRPQLPKGLFDKIWGWPSAWVVGRGAFAGFPVEGHGPTSTTFGQPGYVQGNWETPARRLGGALGGGLSVGTGMYAAMNADRFSNPYVGMTVAGTGVFEATSGIAYLSGAIVGSTEIMKIASAGARAFGGAGLLVASAAQLPGNIERGDTAMILSNTAGTIGGGLMLAAAFGPAGWGVAGLVGLGFGMFCLGGHLGRWAGWW